MGLKYCQYPLGAEMRRGVQRGRYFGWVMRVVLDDENAACVCFNLKPALHSIVEEEPPANLVEGHSQAQAHSNGGERVEDVVLAGCLNLHPAQRSRRAQLFVRVEDFK